ncbi:MAG TPA: transglycosylase domain-containing protein [Acidimicrobiia bacterium]|nr:transglycosylase domain-containing protein [Acidimicrobiia bacterium]
MDKPIREAERLEREGKGLVASAILTGMAVIAATWMGLFVFLGANAAHGTLLDLRAQWIPDVRSMALDLPDLTRLSEVYTADGVLLGKLTERNSQPVEFEDIPTLVLAAALSAEDRNFMTHSGVDYRAVARALARDIVGGPTEGGSTITQQVVKLNFVGNEPTLRRKVAEAVIAIELERRHSKELILEHYLNSVFFGNNAYGIRAAAQEYFGKELGQLTIAEAAALMVPVRNPSLYDLRRDSTIPLRARNAVIDNMVLDRYITEEDGEAAKEDPIVVVPRQEFYDPAPQVLMAARDTILNDPRYGLGSTFLQRKRALFGCPADDDECTGGGGLRVYTTVDFRLQEQARRILQEWFPPGSNGPTGAIAMVDNRTGATVVMASGLDFGTDVEAGQRQYDLATKGRRNPGSAFKPFGTVAALEQGITLNSFWNATSPQKLDFGGTEPWRCANAGGGGAGLRSLERALIASTNTVFCQVAIQVGGEAIVDAAQRMGIRSPLLPIPAIVLGAQAVSPLEMATAFSTLANLGDRYDNYLIERIEDDEGNVIYQHEVSPKRVLSPPLAAAVVNTLELAITQGTGGNAIIGRPMAGKTGTHENFTDAWFVGFIPQYTTAVWVGFPDRQIAMVNLTIHDTFYARVFGGTVPAPIWRQFMQVVTADLPVEEFPVNPPGTEAYYRTMRIAIPDVEGMTLNEATKELYSAGLNFTVTVVNSDKPVDIAIGTNPPAGRQVNQGNTIELLMSSGLSPETAMPDLVGRTRAEADQILTNLRQTTQIDFTWSFVEVDTDDPENDGRVSSTRPAANGKIEEGTAIQVSVFALEE